MDRIKFAVEPEALANENPETAAEMEFLKNRIYELVAFWDSLGTFVDPDSALRLLRERLDDPDLAWDPGQLEFLKSTIKRNVNSSIHILESDEGEDLKIWWEDTENPESGDLSMKIEEWLPDFEIALVGRRIASSIDLTHGKDCIDIPPDNPVDFMDVVRWEYGISRSCKKRELDRFLTPYYQSGIDTSDRTSEVWAERFRPFAQGSNEVIIVDRYVAKNIENRELLNVLNNLDRDSSGCDVVIYSAILSDDDMPSFATIEEQLERKVNRLSGSGVNSVSLFLCREDTFAKHAHDRYIRFGGFTCTIGHGTDIFRGERVGIDSDYSLKLPNLVGERLSKEKQLLRTKQRKFRFSRRPVN